jgi:hypothetical protein
VLKTIREGFIVLNTSEEQQKRIDLTANVFDLRL